MIRSFLLLSLLFLCQPVLAGNPIDFTPHGSQPGLTFALEGGAKCHSCHAGYYGDPNYDNDKHFMPYTTWAGSMKAQATRDPLFWAALDVANNDIPGVGDFCLKCHTPQGWFKGHVVKPVNQGDPWLDGANGCELQGDHVARNTEGNDYTGVTCHFCHRMDQHGPNGEAQIIENGNVWLDDEACAGGFGPCRKGPYDYPVGGAVGEPPHDWAYSDFIQSAEFCGSCHDVSSPEVDDNGTLRYAQLFWHNGTETAQPMPIERTYTEWQQSLYADLIFRDPLELADYGQIPVLLKGETCQSCHMPQTDNMAARACVFNAPGDRENNLRTHQFAGGNTWVPQVIKAVYGDQLEMVDQGIKELLDLTTTYAENMLQLHSAAVDVELVSNDGTNLVVDVKVTNLTGHKLPTGYPEGRRMWINLLATDDGATDLFESGAYDPVTAVLTEDPQIKVYESLQGQWDEKSGTCEVEDESNNKMFHFVLNDCIYKDNRIPPLGFRGGNDITLAPVGITYPNAPQNSDYLVNYDVTRYTIPVTGAQFPVTVTATLKYQTASKEYIDFLDAEATANSIPSENVMCDRSWTVGPQNQSRGAFAKQLWQNHGQSAPVDMVIDIQQFGGSP
ncbi:hypothetical protein [Marinicella meishanensis]|uniref:hypothetical protein n=1 Tax=Marinicella meishanensis TaxID=2873263 RepID=UPI001CBB8FD9|nr:hypothetical protein [Marinicella sp. NBU2979]